MEHLSTNSQRQLLKTTQGIKILNNQRHGTFKYQSTKATPKNNTRASKSWTIKDIKLKYHFTKATLKSNVRHQNLEQSLLLATNFFSHLDTSLYEAVTQCPHSFGNKSFMQLLRRLSMHLMRSQVFFFLLGELDCFFPCSQCVPHGIIQVPKLFPKSSK